MNKYYKLLDPKHKGLYVYHDKEGYYLVKSEMIYDKSWTIIDEEDKFYMTPYFLRDTEVYDEYEEVDDVESDYAEKMLALYNKAKEIAEKAHKDQVDKNGKPYIEHIYRVADRLGYLEEKIIALLHDTLEDTDVTEEDLRKEFPEFVVEAVKALTRDKEKESYEEFIKRAALNDMAIKVKVADIKDNYERKMLEPRPDLKKRYKEALEFLGD